MRRSFSRLLTVRLSLAASVIALVFGVVVYFYEIERIDEAAVDLVTLEARTFAELHPTALASTERIEERLKAFLAEREGGADGHFVLAEVYDADSRTLAEASLDDVAKVEAGFNRNTHPFPHDGQAHYDKLTVDGRLYLRVLTDLHAAPFDGFFEGIFEVAPARLIRVQENVFATVTIVIGVVIGTTLFLLPIVIGLNHHLVTLSGRLLRANVEILEVLGSAIAKRDSDTGQHNYRVTLYAVHLAEALGRTPEEIRSLIKGAFLHDVGKIAITDTILLKPGKLTADEFEVMKTHVGHGVDIVARSGWLDDAKPVVAGHHEKFDGSGYPAGVAGDTIPIGARVFAVVDVFDALTSRRPYKDAMPVEKAIAILEDGRGRHFDPAILDAFTPIARDLHRRFADELEEILRTTVLTVTARYFSPYF
jgi:HD-GYP domain-containing protein (c-di-GMP phosphodiesterase class II)